MLVWECWLDGMPQPAPFNPGNWIATPPGYWDSIEGEYTNCTSDLILTSVESTTDVGYMLYFSFIINIEQTLPPTAKIIIRDEGSNVTDSVDISSYDIGVKRVTLSVHNPRLIFTGKIVLKLEGIIPCSVTIKEILYSYDKKSGGSGGDPEVTTSHIITNTDTVSNCGVFDPNFIQFCGSTDGLPIITGGDPHWDNVILLMHMESLGVDSSGKNNHFTSSGVAAPYNGASISTSNFKFDTSSLYSVSDYMIGPVNSDFFLDGDFTIEFWLYKTDIIVGNVLYFMDGALFNLWITSNSSTITFKYGRNYDTDATITHPSSLNKWIHIAAVKSANKIYVFADGIKSSEVTISNYPPSISFTSIGTTNCSQYIDELRITKGVVRYANDFEPPTAPFDDYAYVEPVNAYEGSWKLYHSTEGNNIYTQYYDSVEPYFCTSVDLPLLDDKIIFNSPPFPVLVSEAILVSAALLVGQLMNTVTTEAIDVSAQLLSGELLRILVAYSYYQPEAINVSANLDTGIFLTVQSFISYPYYQPEAVEVSAQLLSGEFLTVQSFISYPYYQPEALSVSASLIGGTLV